MSQTFRYPSGASISIAAIGTNGSAAPSSSIEVAGKDGAGLLKPLSVDTSGVLNVSVASFPLPADAATASNQVLQLAQETSSANSLTTLAAVDFATETTLAAMNTKIPSGLTVTSTRLVVDGSGVTQPVSAASLPLPTGAATETTLSAVNTKLAGTLAVSAASLPLPTGAATETTLAAVNTKLAGTLAVSAASLPLPSGAATETTLAAMSAKLPAALGQTTMSASMSVALASNQSTVPTSQAGRAKANAPTYNDYSSTNVTTGAYVQLIASTSSATSMVEIFDSSGQALFLAVGGSGSEVDQLLIYPGGNGQVPLAIPAGSRVSLKAKTATANSGYIIANLYT